MKHIQNFEGFLNESRKFKKGDKVKTREGKIETVVRVNSNGNVETEENDYSWPADSLEIVKESVNEKTITIDWDDDEQSLIFSDAGPIPVNYDGDFKYRGKRFSTADHQGPDDLINDLSNAFRSDKFVYSSDL